MIPECVHLGIADARALSERAMRGIGYEPEEARILADHVIDAALCGDEYSGLPKRIVHTRTGDPAPTHPMADSPAVLPLSACRLLCLVSREAPP